MLLMDKIRETLSALEQLRGQLNGIVSNEILETDRILRSLMEDVVGVERSELTTRRTLNTFTHPQHHLIVEFVFLKNLLFLIFLSSLPLSFIVSFFFFKPSVIFFQHFINVHARSRDRLRGKKSSSTILGVSQIFFQAIQIGS